jgi:hypothetical protein
LGKEGNGSRPAVPKRGKEELKMQKQEKQSKTKGIIMVHAVSVQWAPLLLRGGARRRPLPQGGGGGRGVYVLALRHKCGN